MSFEPISNEQMITVAGGSCAAAPTNNRIRGGAGLGAGAEGGASPAAGGGCQQLLGALQSLLAQFGLGGALGGASPSAGAEAGAESAAPTRSPAGRAAADPSSAGSCACAPR